MENGGSSIAGTLKLGIKLDDDDTEILTLAVIEKTPGHDFCLETVHCTKGSSHITCGVMKTPEDYPEDYNESTYLRFGFPDLRDPMIRLNCTAQDTWEEIPAVKPFKKSYSPATTTTTEILSLEQRIAALQEFHSTTKKESSVAVAFDDGSVYQGTFYTTQANAGTLVIHMEKGGSSAAGTLKLGVKLGDDDTEVLTLAIIEKTPGHDFCIREANFKSPSITYGVVKTPEGYNESTCLFLGYPNTKRVPSIDVHCVQEDAWREIPGISPYKRSHSPTPAKR